MNFSTLKAGTATERKLIVDRERTISFLGEDLRIYATPRLLDDIEQTCLDYLLTFLDEGKTPSARRSISATSAPHCWACR